MPVAHFAKITHHMIWTKVSWQWHIIELSQKFLMLNKILKDHNYELSTLFLEFKTIQNGKPLSTASILATNILYKALDAAAYAAWILSGKLDNINIILAKSGQ